MPLQVEARPTSGASGDTATLSPGVSRTLIFRVSNLLDEPQAVRSRVVAPEGWQVLFSRDQLTIPAVASLLETIVVVPPRTTRAGTYTVRYEVSRAAGELPVTANVVLRVRERHALAISWLDPLEYMPAGGVEAVALLVSNEGNVAETVSVRVRSSLGSVLRSSWTTATLAPGEARRVEVEVRPLARIAAAARDTLTATATLASVEDTYQAATQFDVIPEGRGLAPARTRLPTTLAFRTGSDRAPGFGWYTGSGMLDRDRELAIDFGFIAREESHPLLLERDRHYLTLTAPRGQIALGDQTWSLSRLTEAGRYGFGGGGRLERGRWDVGLFVDTGRRDIDEATQTGGFLGLRMGRVRASAQYLERHGRTALQWQQPARLASVRLELTPLPGLRADVEVGRGGSGGVWSTAAAGELRYTARVVSMYARRIRADDAYPIRDRTALIDGAGVSYRPVGHLQLEGTFDGTEQLFDDSLPPETPTRQRISRAAVSWGATARVQYARQAWSSPFIGWSAAWRRESVSAQLALPFGPLLFSPGAERGTVANPEVAAAPFTRQWLRVGARLGSRVNVYMRGEYGRGVASDADRVIRRLSAGGTVQPVTGTTVRFQLHESATDVPWLEGTQWATATLDQRLPWDHHLVGTYRRVASRTAFVRQSEAYRLDYVIPLGIPLRRPAEGAGGVTVQIRNADSGQGLGGVLVEIAGRVLLTDGRGLAQFATIPSGEYYLTAGAGGLPPGHTIQPALPMRVSVIAGRTSRIAATVVRTTVLSGAVQLFEPSSGGLAVRDASGLVPRAGLAGAVIELTSGEERRVAATDASGRFSFDDLPPGEWLLTIVSATVPPFYQIEEPQLTISLAPGQRLNVVLRVVPKPRDGAPAPSSRRHSTDGATTARAGGEPW